jgi:hypothetical protein
MGHWDAVVSDFQGVDVNRVVRNGIDIMEREPDAWRAKILILAAAYPGVDWSQVTPPDFPEAPMNSLHARGASEASCMHQASQGVHEVPAGHTCACSRTIAGQQLTGSVLILHSSSRSTRRCATCRMQRWRAP